MQAASPTQTNESFTEPRLARDSMDRYTQRSAILRELRAAMPVLRGRLLDVGCGQMPYRELIREHAAEVTDYVGLDMTTERYGTQPDLTWDGVTMPIEDASFDCAIATEVFEHCPDPAMTMREVRRVLKDDGLLFFTVPFLWPLHEVPYDAYRYTPFTLERLLKDAGFASVEVQATGGWDASLAQLIGLWANRRPMHGVKAKVVKWAALRAIRWLLRKDEIPSQFRESTMLTGLAGIARVTASGPDADGQVAAATGTNGNGASAPPSHDGDKEDQP